VSRKALQRVVPTAAGYVNCHEAAKWLMGLG